MTKNVYVLGSANYDTMIAADRMPVQGETIHGFDYLETMGGKGSNQAQAASIKGANVYFIGSVGKDQNGQMIKKYLQERQVNIDLIRQSHQPTGSAVIINIEGDNRIILNEGANGDLDIDYTTNSLKQAKSGDIFLCQFENPIKVALETLKYAKETKGMVTVLNPAPAVEFPLEYYKYIDYLIVNESETEVLSGINPSDSESSLQAAEVLIKRGVINVIITLGSQGSYYVNDQGIGKYFEPFKVKVIDSTGAGDTFIGNFVAGLAFKQDIVENLWKSNAAGAFACQYQGATTGMPTELQLNKFIIEQENKNEKNF